MIALFLAALCGATEPPEAPDPFAEPLRLMQEVTESGYARGGTLLAVVALAQHPDHSRAPVVRLVVSRFQRDNGLLAEEEQTLAVGMSAHASRWHPWFDLALMDAQLQRRDFDALSEAHEERADWPEDIRDAAHFYGAWGRAGQGDEAGAQKLLAKVRGPLQAPAREFSDAMAREPLLHRSPGLAGILSAIPGLGHAYAGDGAGAFANLVLTGGLTGTAIYFSTLEEPVLTTVFGVLGAGSWMAGVGDAFKQARMFNATRERIRFVALTDNWWLGAALTEDDQRPLEVEVQPPSDD